MLRAGDGLALDDGRIVEVVAAPENWRRFAGSDAARLCASPGIWAIAICRPNY